MHLTACVFIVLFAFHASLSNWLCVRLYGLWIWSVLLVCFKFIVCDNKRSDLKKHICAYRANSVNNNWLQLTAGPFCTQWTQVYVGEAAYSQLLLHCSRSIHYCEIDSQARLIIIKQQTQMWFSAPLSCCASMCAWLYAQGVAYATYSTASPYAPEFY